MTYRVADAIAEARSYIGTKWLHRGRTRFGIDCIGLIVAAVRAGGVEITDRQDYGRAPWRNGLEREMRQRFGDPVDDLQAGDIVLIRWKDSKEPSHVGVVATGKNGFTLIHSSNTTAVCEHDIDALWQSRIVMVFRP